MDMPGTLLLCGGGDLPAVVWGSFVGHARVLVDTSATADDAEARRKGERYAARIRRAAAPARPRVEVLRRPLPSAEAVAVRLRRVDAVLFGGGAIGRIAARYRGTDVARELSALLCRGGLVAGTSAGAVDLCGVTWDQRGTRLGTGLALARGLVLAVHATDERREGLARLRVSAETARLALVESTAVRATVASAVLVSESGEAPLSAAVERAVCAAFTGCAQMWAGGV